mgnify:CR=1 FL=1
MQNTIRTVVSIVISAVLLGVAVVYCTNLWKPVDSAAWLQFGLGVALAAVAIARIALLAKMLGKNSKEE